MKIKTEQDLTCDEIEITIKYPQKNKQVRRITEFLRSFDMQIRCDIDNEERMINILDIYYIESVKPLFNYQGTLLLETFDSHAGMKSHLSI